MGDDKDPWKQVNVRVRQTTKAEWEEYAETEYGGMSDVVRTAVTREIGGDYDASDGEAGASGEAVTEVAEAIDRLENTVRDMDKRLSAVRESVESGEAYSFEAAVRETVPQEGGLYAGEIAARLDARESDVRDVLEELSGSEVKVYYEEDNQDEPMWTKFGGE